MLLKITRCFLKKDRRQRQKQHSSWKVWGFPPRWTGLPLSLLHTIYCLFLTEMGIQCIDIIDYPCGLSITYNLHSSQSFFFFLSCFSASTKYSWMLLMYLVLRSQFLLFVLHDGFLSQHLKLSVYAKWKRITHFWVYFGKNLAISRIKGFTKVHLHNSKTAGCPSLLDIPIQKKLKGKGEM